MVRYIRVAAISTWKLTFISDAECGYGRDLKITRRIFTDEDVSLCARNIIVYCVIIRGSRYKKQI